MLRVLLTNDDGIQAPGLLAMAAQLAPHCEVLVMAPERQSSAKGQSITLHKPLRVRQVPDYLRLAGSPAVEAYECSGTPADCVIVALHHYFTERRPQLVLSGINDGCNVAQDLVYSGTVGGALEGAVNGIPSLAVSLISRHNLPFQAAAEAIDLLLAILVYGRLFTWHAELVRSWQANHVVGAQQLRWELPDEQDPSAVYPLPGEWFQRHNRSAPCFNVNLPDVDLTAINGICWAQPGYREYTGIVKEVLDPRGEPYYWIAGERTHDTQDPGTDTHSLALGSIAVTPISYDLGIPGRIEQLAAWMRERKA